MRSCPDLERPSAVGSVPRAPKAPLVMGHRRPVVVGTTHIVAPRWDDLPYRPFLLRIRRLLAGIVVTLLSA